MSELREAAQEALFWMQHARLHLTIKERLHPDGLIQYDNAFRNLRAALAQPETAVRPCGECILAADEVCDICGANGTCDVPPMGWRCTRSAGHDGPCATVEAPEQVDFVNRGMDRLRDVQPPTEGSK